MASNESRSRTKSSISRSLVVPTLRPFCHFLFSYFFFSFFFSEWYSKRILEIEISSSILTIFHCRREKRLRKWNWLWWISSWLCYCVMYLRLSMCCTRRTLLDNWSHVILHWERVMKIYVWKDCPTSEFHFYIWHDICFLSSLHLQITCFPMKLCIVILLICTKLNLNILNYNTTFLNIVLKNISFTDSVKIARFYLICPDSR